MLGSKQIKSTCQFMKNENLKGKIVATLSGGTAVTVLKEAGNGAYQVQLSDDQVGYISSSYVTFGKNKNLHQNKFQILPPHPFPPRKRFSMK